MQHGLFEQSVQRTQMSLPTAQLRSEAMSSDEDDGGTEYLQASINRKRGHEESLRQLTGARSYRRAEVEQRRVENRRRHEEAMQRIADDRKRLEENRQQFGNMAAHRLQVQRRAEDRSRHEEVAEARQGLRILEQAQVGKQMPDRAVTDIQHSRRGSHDELKRKLERRREEQAGAEEHAAEAREGLRMLEKAQVGRQMPAQREMPAEGPRQQQQWTARTTGPEMLKKMFGEHEARMTRLIIERDEAVARAERLERDNEELRRR